MSIEPDKYNVSEAEMLKTIESIVNQLSRKFQFGYFDVEDMKQQGTLFALEAMPRWDGTRSLYNFLYTHVHNRFINFKRDKFSRLSKPCDGCKYRQYNCLDIDSCEKHEIREDCKSYRRWFDRNNTKKNLMQPLDINNIDDSEEKNTHFICDSGEDMDYQELLEKIENKIPSNMRGLFLRLKYNAALTKNQKNKLKNIITEIIGGTDD
jgi:DNA-directed RNA polymerase specialized sigma24 family protein